MEDAIIRSALEQGLFAGMYLMKELSIPIENVVPHKRWTGTLSRENP